MPLPRRTLAAGLLLVSLGLLSGAHAPRTAASGTLPQRIGDREFWQMIAGFSEPDGYFRSDNLVSNEEAFQSVIPALQKRSAPGGVYLGVGPEQNFAYLVAIRPRLAFIIDIRRQNMLLHLLYKALIEGAADRAAFLSRLFSRPVPGGLDRAAAPDVLFDAFRAAAPDPMLFQWNLHDVIDLLVRHHGFPLSNEDRQAIEYVYRAFFAGGPDLRYSFPRPDSWRRFPSYAELQTSRDGQGVNHGYLSSEQAFRVVKDLEATNRVVPIVGDFSGDKAIRAVARYLKDRGATVTAFYTSNVEMYLFRNNRWTAFIENVATLPTDGHSTFIRAYFGFGARGFSPRLMGGPGGMRSAILLDPIAALVADSREGRIQSYADLANRPR
jgi:hypothetical protein